MRLFIYDTNIPSTVPSMELRKFSVNYKLFNVKV